MSIVAMNWAWGRRLKPTAKLVLMSLADAADDHGVCWPGIPTVARKCCISTRTVRRIEQELTDNGLPRAEPRFRQDHSRSSKRYSLALEGGDNLSEAPDGGDRGPMTSVTGPPDTGVTPRTTNRSSNELPPPQKAPSKAWVLDASTRGGGHWDQLEYPKGFSERERQGTQKLLAELPHDLAQQLLDELAGRMTAETIRLAPLAYLRGLVRRANSGDFTPELALRVADVRKRRRQVEGAVQRAEAAYEGSLEANRTGEDNPLLRNLVALRHKLRQGEPNSR